MVIDQMRSRRIITQPAMNSARTRYGQVWTLSGSWVSAAERFFPASTFTCSWSFGMGLTLTASAMAFLAPLALLQRTGDPAVLPDAPEVQDHQDADHDGDGNAVQHVEAH